LSNIVYDVGSFRGFPMTSKKFEILTGLLLLVLIVTACMGVEFLIAFTIGALTAICLHTLFNRRIVPGMIISALFILGITYLSIKGQFYATGDLFLALLICLGGFLPWSIAEAWFQT